MAKTSPGQLLDEAERLCQVRGFNAFSFKALAESQGIKTASVHYHFPSKADLGRALVRRYRERFEDHVARLDDDATPPEQIKAYTELYVKLAKQGRICLCGSLAADFETLPEEVQAEVQEYFTVSERWLEQVLNAGRESGELTFAGKPRAVARLIIDALEGAMLSARAFSSPKRIKDTQRWILDHLLEVSR